MWAAGEKGNKAACTKGFNRALRHQRTQENASNYTLANDSERILQLLVSLTKKFKKKLFVFNKREVFAALAKEIFQVALCWGKNLGRWNVARVNSFIDSLLRTKTEHQNADSRAEEWKGHNFLRSFASSVKEFFFFFQLPHVQCFWFSIRDYSM